MVALREERLIGYKLGDISLNEISPILEKRVCAHEDCDTILSQYNKESMCSIHYKTRPKIQKEVKMVTLSCPSCQAPRQVKYINKSKLEKAKLSLCRSCSRKKVLSDCSSAD